MTHQSPKTHRDPPEPRLLDDGFLDEEPRVPFTGWALDDPPPVAPITRRDFLLSAIAIALLAAIVALLASGAWEQADAEEGEVGTVLLGGKATWYEDPRKSGHYAAAGPLLREALGDWRGRYVTVEAGDRSVTVQLTDWCACGERGELPTLLDLSREAFAELADPSVGVITVSIEIDPPPHPDDERMRLEDRPLPATDTEETP